MSQLFEVQYIYRYFITKRKKEEEEEEEEDQEEPKAETQSLPLEDTEWTFLGSMFSWFDDGTPTQWLHIKTFARVYVNNKCVTLFNWRCENMFN